MKSEIYIDTKPILIISASDSSGAAGMQVDVRVAQELGIPVRCAVTALTVQGDIGVVRTTPSDPETLELSIKTALEDEPGIGAVKIGLLTGTDAVMAVSSGLSLLPGDVPVVADPVVRSTSGSQMADDRSIIAICEYIVSLGTVLTPNMDELSKLSKAAGISTNDVRLQAESLLDRGAGAVLVTGGDGEGDTCIDVLFPGPNEAPVSIRHPRIEGQTPRGTGCALSTALAVFLAQGVPLREAVEHSINYVVNKIGNSIVVGKQRLLFGPKITID